MVWEERRIVGVETDAISLLYRIKRMNSKTNPWGIPTLLCSFLESHSMLCSHRALLLHFEEKYSSHYFDMKKYISSNVLINYFFTWKFSKCTKTFYMFGYSTALIYESKDYVLLIKDSHRLILISQFIPTPEFLTSTTICNSTLSNTET